MNITFKNTKTQKTFNSEKLLKKEYGERAKFIKRRMAMLRASNNLSDVPADKPERCHSLKGKRAGEFSVDLKQPYRLIFEPDHQPIPKRDNGEVDLTKITSIKIICVEDYH